MARLINIIKVDEDPDTVYYRFGDGADALIANAGICKSTGETVLLQVDPDGALRHINTNKCKWLGIAARTAWEADSPPATFTYRTGLLRPAQVHVLNVTEEEALLEVHGCTWDVATATCNFATRKAQFIALRNCQKYSEIVAADMFRFVQWILERHFAKGEFPDEPAFMS